MFSQSTNWTIDGIKVVFATDGITSCSSKTPVVSYLNLKPCIYGFWKISPGRMNAAAYTDYSDYDYQSINQQARLGFANRGGKANIAREYQRWKRNFCLKLNFVCRILVWDGNSFWKGAKFLNILCNFVKNMLNGMDRPVARILKRGCTPL